MNLIKINLNSEHVPRILILLFAVVAGLGLGFGPGLAMDQYRKEPPRNRSSTGVEKETTLNITNITHTINVTNISNIANITNFTNSTSTIIEIDVNITSNKRNTTNSTNDDILEMIDLSASPSLASVTPIVLDSFSPTIHHSSLPISSFSPSLSPTTSANESNKPSFTSQMPSIQSSLFVPSLSPSLSVSEAPSAFDSLLHSQSPSLHLSHDSTNSTNSIVTNIPSHTPQSETISVAPTIKSSKIQINKEAPITTNMPSIELSTSPTTSFSPSRAPKTRNEIEMILTSVSSLDALNAEGTYQNKAFSWLLETFSFPSETDDYQIKQKYILASLYFATGGENWTHKYNFLSPDMHECTWKGSETGLLSGVQLCNDDLQITKLSLGTS